MAKISSLVPGFQGIKQEIFNAHDVTVNEATDINDFAQNVVADVQQRRRVASSPVLVDKNLHLVVCEFCELEIETMKNLVSCPCCGNPIPQSN